MSREEVRRIICGFNNEHYAEHVHNHFTRSEYSRSWSKERILRGLGEAFRSGYGGMHFIPSEYEACLSEILDDYLGRDHCIAYRICRQHGMICLEPNFRKLGVSPLDYISESFRTDKEIHALREESRCISFCFNLD